MYGIVLDIIYFISNPSPAVINPVKRVHGYDPTFFRFSNTRNMYPTNVVKCLN